MKKRIILEIMDYLRLIVTVVVITTLLNTLLFTFSTVQQSSMEHTLHENDVLIIEKTTYLFGSPKSGDIIVFVEDEPVAKSYFKKLAVLFQDIGGKFTRNPVRTRLVKRVIGVPGDVIVIKDGQVTVNDLILDEAYVEDATYVKVIEYPVTVPEGQFFVLGDNRDVSKDSRHFGLIEETHIEGKVIFRLAPFNVFGMVE